LNEANRIKRIYILEPGESEEEQAFSKRIQEITVEEGYERIERYVYPYYCRCGKPLLQEDSRRCSICRRLICINCSIEHNGRTYCIDCIKTVHELSKTEYLVLLALLTGNLRKTVELMGIERREAEENIRRLEAKGYIVRRGLIFKKYRIRQAGYEALTLYDRIYGVHPDVALLKKLLIYRILNEGP